METATAGTADAKTEADITMDERSTGGLPRGAATLLTDLPVEVLAIVGGRLSLADVGAVRSTCWATVGFGPPVFPSLNLMSPTAQLDAKLACGFLAGDAGTMLRVLRWLRLDRERALSLVLLAAQTFEPTEVPPEPRGVISEVLIELGHDFALGEGHAHRGTLSGASLFCHLATWVLRVSGGCMARPTRDWTATTDDRYDRTIALWVVLSRPDATPVLHALTDCLFDMHEGREVAPGTSAVVSIVRHPASVGPCM